MEDFPGHVPGGPEPATPHIRFLFVAPCFHVGLPRAAQALAPRVPPHLAVTQLPFRFPSASPIPGAGTRTPQATCHARHTRLHALCVPRAEHKVAMQGIVRLLQIL